MQVLTEWGMPVPDVAVTEAIFSAPTPATGKVSAGVAMLPNGSAVVFAVSKVTPGDVATMPPQQREMLQGQIAEIGGSDDVKAMVSAMRKRVKVTVVERNL